MSALILGAQDSHVIASMKTQNTAYVFFVCFTHLTGSGKLILRKRLECRLMLKKGSEDKNHNNEDIKSYTVCFQNL